MRFIQLQTHSAFRSPSPTMLSYSILVGIASYVMHPCCRRSFSLPSALYNIVYWSFSCVDSLRSSRSLSKLFIAQTWSLICSSKENCFCEVYFLSDFFLQSGGRYIIISSLGLDDRFRVEIFLRDSWFTFQDHKDNPYCYLIAYLLFCFQMYQMYHFSPHSIFLNITH